MTLLKRRSALGVLGAVGMLRPVFGKTPAPDFDQPPQLLKALQKILVSSDPAQTVLSFAAGRVYGCIAGQPPIPLFGTHSVVAARALAHDDGTFTARQHIIGFRTAFGTETVIDRMRNPITQEMLDLPLTDYGIGDTLYGRDGVFALRDGRKIQQGQGGARPWSLDGDVLAVNDDTLTQAPGPNQPKVDVVTRYANLRDIVDPKVHAPRSWFNFSAVDPFRPWLKMPQPGFQLWHVAGRKVAGEKDLPPYIRHFIAERFPHLGDVPPLNT